MLAGEKLTVKGSYSIKQEADNKDYCKGRAGVFIGTAFLLVMGRSFWGPIICSTVLYSLLFFFLVHTSKKKLLKKQMQINGEGRYLYGRWPLLHRGPWTYDLRVGEWERRTQQWVVS